MPAVAITSWTVDMLDDLPDTSERLEIIDGTLYVTPSPSNPHQAVAGGLYRCLYAYLGKSGPGYAFISPSDVRRGDQDRNRVQPDVYVVRRTDRRLPAEPCQLSDLLLAVEVASPSNPSLDYEIKRRLYLREGVAEYWIASPQERVISRWCGPGDSGSTVRDVLEWHPGGMRAPLRIDVQELFSDLD
jgi:Uma2 family endonuclease